jgi:PAS domain S-box-containing protein
VIPPHPKSPASAPPGKAPSNVSESRFLGAIAASLDAFFLCESVRDPHGVIVDFKIVELNERGEIFLARQRSDLLGRLVCEIIPSLRDGFIAQFIQVVETGESLEDEIRVQDDDGETRWIRHQVVRVEDGVAITSRDITARKRVQDALAISEARFRHLVESASDGIYRIDPHGIFTYANPVASHLLGFTADQSGIVGRLYLDFVRRDYHKQGIELYKRQVVERIPVTYWEFPAITVDGRELWVGQNVHIEQRNGSVTSLFAVARDITERKTAELALRESEERHRFLAENSTDMLSRQAPDGTVLYASPVCLKLLGYSPAELVGTSVFDYCHPDDLESVRAACARLLGHEGSETMTYRVRRRDGHYIWFETTSQGVREQKGSGLVAEVLSVSRDVTERRHMEEELRQAQKMEAVGQLAGGVAHDFNNLLTAIRGFSDLLARGIEPGDPRRKDVAEIMKATERAAALTRQLLAFSKRQILRLEPLSVNVIVEDMAKIIRRLLGEGVTVETALETNVWTVRADPGQFEQVLLNLALNARDAMGKRGTLRVVSRNVEVAPSVGDSVLSPGRYVVVEVKDSGVGMTDATRARVFEPFFTTKDPTGRSGLGLATVYGIVMQMGGHISVSSAVGDGTTFTIHLPAVVEDSINGGRDTSPTPRSTNRNVILIAEDNEGVRALTVRLLADAGYQVFEGCDGMDALDTLRTLDEPVDLLISDVMMPRMNGSELVSQFQRIQPGTPILLMSGFMDEEAVRRSFANPDAILSKPFTAEALLGRVKELIGAAR